MSTLTVALTMPATTTLTMTATSVEFPPEAKNTGKTSKIILKPTEPHLPPELEREIFELAARTNRAHAVRLLLVAQRVKIWIEPLLFEVIAWNEGSTTGKPCDCSRIPVEILVSRYAPHVRHLLIASGRIHGELQDYLNLCSGVEDLAVWSSLSMETLKVLESWPIRRLSFSFDGLFVDGLKLGGPLFAQVTHLDIVDFDRCDAWDAENNLGMIPNLTHIAFNEVVPKELVVGILKHCAKLQVLMLLDSSQNADEWDEDARVVRSSDVQIGSDTPRHDWIADWKLGTEGKLDFWARADGVVAARLKAAALGQHSGPNVSDIC